MGFPNLFLYGKTVATKKACFRPKMFLSSFTNEILPLSFIKGKFQYTVKCSNQILP